MRYRPMRFDPEYRPFVAPECIYIIPLSADPSRYQVLIPAGLRKHLLDLLIQEKLLIRRFRGCPAEAVSSIEAQLEHNCREKPSRYSTRTNQLVATGSVLLVLGIINGAFPDPLPLADEILMIGGGLAVGISGYLQRRRVLPLLQDKTETAVQRLCGLDCPDDPLLSRIYDAIRARGAPDPAGSKSTDVDLFEMESRWLVEYLDLHRLLDSQIVTVDDLRALVDALSGAFPLSRFLNMEQKLRGNPKDGRTRRARNRTADAYGLSADAFTVYAEFHRLSAEILSV
ncbi:MAG: hypothetical protein JXB06_15765 [Spirochaetales bacterium]|nr:hypothetical protein [Spirochaetales bacterium]